MVKSGLQRPPDGHGEASTLLSSWCAVVIMAGFVRNSVRRYGTLFRLPMPATVMCFGSNIKLVDPFAPFRPTNLIRTVSK